MEDLPVILDFVGGRVSDYRVADFAAFMQMHRFFPLKPIPEHKPDESLHRARQKIYRRSRYFPLTANATIVHNIGYMGFLLKKIAKDSLDETEVIQCRQHIFNLLGSASRQEVLPLTNISSK